MGYGLSPGGAGDLVFPFGNVLGPLVVWLMKKNDSPFVDEQGKEALNFQLSMTIYLLVAGLTIFVAIGIVLLPLVLLADVVLTIIAAVRANNGESYRYPATIRFIQ